VAINGSPKKLGTKGKRTEDSFGSVQGKGLYAASFVETGGVLNVFPINITNNPGCFSNTNIS
jgi:hypothetical protein